MLRQRLVIVAALTGTVPIERLFPAGFLLSRSGGLLLAGYGVWLLSTALI